MKKRFWALRDKYLPALLITLFAAIAADGQVYQRNLTGYGNQGRRLAADSTINIPTGCGAPTTTQEHGMQGEMRMAKLFYDSCGANFYVYNPSTATWGVLTASASGGFESLGDGFGLNVPNDSTYNVDSLVFTTKADRHHLKDSLINVLNLRTIQQVLTAGNLITNPAQTIENDPSNTTGTFGIKQGVGGSTLGDLLVGYRNNRFINSNSSASYLAGFYSSIDTLTAFGSLRKAPSVGIGTLLNNTKWQHVVIDSNEVKIVADSVNMTGRIKVSGQVRIGTVSGGIVAPSTSTQLPLVIARNSAGPSGLVGVYAYGSGTKAGSIGSITMQGLGLFTGDQTDQVLLDVNGGTAFGKSPGGGTPVDGLMVKGRTRLNDTLQLVKAFVSSSSSDSVLVKDASGYVKSAVPLSSLSAGGSGTNNANAGGGFRLLKPASQEIKTVFADYGITIDSTSNTDGITIKADTATLFDAIRSTITDTSNLGNSDLTQTNEPRVFNHNGLDFRWNNNGETRWYGYAGYGSERIMIVDGKMGRWYGGRVGTGVYFEAGDSLYARGVAASTDTANKYVLVETTNDGIQKVRAGAFGGGTSSAVSDVTLAAAQALGSPFKALGIDLPMTICNTGSALTDAQIRMTAVYVTESTTLNGVAAFIRTQGNYTGDNNNKVALYSYSGGTLNKVAESTNDANLWTAAANDFLQVAFSTPYSASPGIYFAAILYNNSTQTTAPAVAAAANLSVAAQQNLKFTNSAKFYLTLSGQADMSSSYAMSSAAQSATPTFLAVY